MGENKLEASVGMSREWDARKAGQEVAKSAIEKLEHPPGFFLLFSTIHYEKHGGFEEFLHGVWDILPDETPLIGGTIAGFMNKKGCFTRGATALAVYSDNIDVEVAIGHNTKSNPEKAVDECFSNFKILDDTKNQLFLEVVSGAVIPNFPKIGRQTVIKSKSAGATAIKLIPLMSRLNMGPDRADEILEYIIKKFPNSKLIGLTCIDDRKLVNNYQFFNKNVFKNALCLLKINTGFQLDINTSFGLIKKTDSIFDFDLGNNKRIVKKINCKTAASEFYNIIGFDQENVKMIDRFYSQSFFYPFGYEEGRFVHLSILGGIFGDKLIFSNQIRNTKLNLFQLTGQQILKSTDELLETINVNDFLNFFVMCETYNETLGSSIYKIYEKIMEKIQNEFLVVFASGESIHHGDGIPHYLYESLNSLAIK